MDIDKNILEIRNISLNFGGLIALENVDLDIGERGIFSLIGPNGAGKTSLINCITGFYHPQAGSISFCGTDILGMPSYKIAKLGIARTFQNIALYDGLSVLNNLLAARHVFMRANFITAPLYFGWARREEVEQRRFIEEIIDFLEIWSIRNQIVANLPYGLRKLVDLGRALALEPKLLLLDEPMAGMSVEEKENMARFILDILETRKIPIVLVEHDMSFVMDISDHITVLDFGIKIAEGNAESIISNPKVISVYLGAKEAGFADSKMSKVSKV